MIDFCHHRLFNIVHVIADLFLDLQGAELDELAVQVLGVVPELSEHIPHPGLEMVRGEGDEEDPYLGSPTARRSGEDPPGTTSASALLR